MARDPLIISRIPASLEARILAQCEATGETKSEVLRSALTQYLDNGTQPPAPKPPVASSARSARPARSTGRCSHRVPTGSFCGRCGRLVV